MAALEMARFRVAPEHEHDMREKRRAAIAALRRVCPGLVSEQLARVDERTWMDLIVWETRAAAEAAAEKALEIPEAAAYFGTLEEVVAMEHAEIVTT